MSENITFEKILRICAEKAPEFIKELADNEYCEANFGTEMSS